MKKGIWRAVEWVNPDGTGEKLRLREVAIPTDDVMIRATRKFMMDNYGRDSIWLRPVMIVFHAMGDGDLQRSLEVSSFLNDSLPSAWATLRKAGAVPNCAHFIVDRDGSIYCLTPPRNEAGEPEYRGPHRWLVRRHQDANPVAIGIENVTPEGDWTSLTKEQIESNSILARWLVSFEHGNIRYVTSHHQFNDDKTYESFLNAFGLHHYRRKFRTVGRRDVGNETFEKIVQHTNRSGVRLVPFFNSR